MADATDPPAPTAQLEETATKDQDSAIETTTVGTTTIPTTTEPTTETYPFLVASQDSVTNGEPPTIDNAKLASAKRKRTRYASCTCR